MARKYLEDLPKNESENLNTELFLKQIGVGIEITEEPAKKEAPLKKEAPEKKRGTSKKRRTSKEEEKQGEKSRGGRRHGFFRSNNQRKRSPRIKIIGIK